MRSSLINRNITVGELRTSIRIEPELWRALHYICDKEEQTLSETLEPFEKRGHGSRTSRIRVFIVQYLMGEKMP